MIATVYSGDVELGPLLVALGAASRPAHAAPLPRPVRPGVLRGSASRSGSRCFLRDRPDRHRPRHGHADVRVQPRRARRSTRRRSCSGCSGSSRRRSWPARPGRASRRVSPNERLQQLCHPWTSYVIVPLFALANAGIAIDGDFLARALHLAGHARHRHRLRGRQARRLPRRVLARHAAEPRPAAAAGGLGRGRRRRHDRRASGSRSRCSIADARLHGRPAGGGEVRRPRRRRRSPPVSTWVVFRLTARCRRGRGSGRCSGTPSRSSTSPTPVDPDRDHVRGPEDAPVTLVEYGDFECPYCGQAEPVVRELLAELRRRPLRVAAPAARATCTRTPQLAAEAAEAAAEQGAFWEMHDLLLDHQDALRPRDLLGYAARARARRRALRRRPARARGARRGSPRTSTPPT